MLLIFSIILFVLLVIFFVVIRFTLKGHFKRISLPGDISYMNQNLIPVFEKGALLILVFMLIFLILTFI